MVRAQMYEGAGDRIREARRQAAITQAELAEKSGISEDSINKLEGGRHSPRPTTLRKLAAALGVDVGELMPGPARPRPQPRRRSIGLARGERIKVGPGQPAADAVSAGRE